MVKSRKIRGQHGRKTRKAQKNIGIIRGGRVNEKYNWFIRIVDDCTKYFWLNDINWKADVDIAKRTSSYNKTLKLKNRRFLRRISIHCNGFNYQSFKYDV